MTGTKNRAFESEEGESPDRQDGRSNGGHDASSFSRKVFPHGIHAPDISKFVTIFNVLKFNFYSLFFQFNFNEFATRKTIAQGK